VAGSLQQLWHRAQQAGDSELAAEVLHTMQLCGLGQPEAGSRAGAVSSARMSLGLVAAQAQAGAEGPDQGSAAPAHRSSAAAAAPADRRPLPPVLIELRLLREAADLGGLRRAWGDWQLAQLQRRQRDLWAELEVASYFTQAVAE
jgi:hypothetical protein